jgi:hypothetical protein
MRDHSFIATASAVVVTCLLLLSSDAPAYAMDQVSIGDVQASMRTLSFLESLPTQGPIGVGVVYSPELPGADVLAQATAQLIGSIHGPNSRPLQPVLISTNDLAHFQGHLDVLFLVEGTCKHAALILDTIRHHRLVSISNDPACADSQCCVISVHDGQRVEITLDTALGDAVGARFSLVFTMVVKRK